MFPEKECVVLHGRGITNHLNVDVTLLFQSFLLKFFFYLLTLLTPASKQCGESCLWRSGTVFPARLTIYNSGTVTIVVRTTELCVASEHLDSAFLMFTDYTALQG